jgi:hypothetical protein
MKYQLENGLGKISVRLSEIGSYFHYKKPIATVWNNCEGSTGKFLSLLPNDQAYINDVRNTILDNLHWDYTGKTDKLLDLLKPLFKLFPNGEYDLNYYHSRNKKYFEYNLWHDHNTKYYDWRYLFSEQTNQQTAEIKQNEYDKIKASRHELFTLLHFSTRGFYGQGWRILIGTQPKSEINEDRVKYFEDQIKSGKRPFAIILNCSIPKTYEYSKDETRKYMMQSADYILDGHHKIKAYDNLGIFPSIAAITHCPKTRDEVEFDIEDLIEALYPWQMSHILENCDESSPYISRYLNNPNSKIHNFSRIGREKF